MNLRFNIIACLLLSAIRVSGEPVLDEQILRKVLIQKCDVVSQFYKDEGFPTLPLNPQNCTFESTVDPDYKQEVAAFKSTVTAPLSAEILPGLDRVIKFTNYAAAHATYGPKVTVYEKPPPAKWTKAHAIEVAARFADIFVKPFGARLGPPDAFFSDQSGDVDLNTRTFKYGPGKWTVRWGRQTLSGVPYDSDGVVVNLSEEVGPYLIFLYFTSDYEDEHITPIAKDKALIEARKGLNKILAWAPAKGWLTGAQPVGEPSTGLMIVEPNKMLSQKSLADLAFSGNRKARLAWVSLYHVASPTDPNVNGDVSVYIDAKDGSFLGGYF